MHTRQNILKHFSRKQKLWENAHTAKTYFTDLSFFPGKGIFTCYQFSHLTTIFFIGETAIFRTQFSSHTTIESSHTTVESSHTTVESSRTTVESCRTTIESCWTTIESCWTTIESCWTTVESCWTTIESCRSTREQKYEENSRILHNLAFVWSKSIKIEHGPAISIDCLDLSPK